MIEVLDASVLAKWFVEEKGRDAALLVLADVVERPRRFAVPSLAWYELNHVLLRVTRGSEATRRRLERIMLLGIPSFSTTPERCLRAMSIASKLRLSGYDAQYVALAEELEGRWLTFDAKAAKSVVPRTRVRCLA